MSRCYECDRYLYLPVIIDGHPYCNPCAAEVKGEAEPFQTKPDYTKSDYTKRGDIASDEGDSQNRPVRIGTVSVDPETGEHVMAPDFPGDVELRWRPPDSGTLNSAAPCSNLGAKLEYRPVPHDAEVTARIDAILRDHSVSETTQEEGYCANAVARERCPECDGTDPDVVHLADLMSDENWHTPLAEQIRMYGERAEEVLDALHRNLECEWFRMAIIRLGVERLTAGYEDYQDTMYRWGVDKRDDEMLEEVADYCVYGTSGDFFRAE